MKLLNERNQIREVVARWRDQYGTGAPPHLLGVLKHLSVLDLETATADDVAAIIGNASWCCPKACHECGVESWDCVELGEEPDYDSSTARICAACLAKALALTTPDATTEGTNGK